VVALTIRAQVGLAVLAAWPAAVVAAALPTTVPTRAQVGLAVLATASSTPSEDFQ